MTYQVFSAILETFLIYVIGALCLKSRMIKNDWLPGLTRVALDVMMPLLTFTAITKNFNRDNLNEFWQMPLLGFLTVAFGALCGLLFIRFMRKDSPDRKAAFLHLCAINNFLYLPIIVLQNLYPEGRHVALLLTMNVGSTIGLWTIGVVTLAGGDWKQGVRNVFSINLYAVLLALPVAAFNIKLPPVLSHGLAQVGSMCVPFSLLLIGAALYNIGGKVLNHWGDALWYSAVRLVFIPLLTILLLRMLPLSTEVFQTLAVVALMPASCNAVLMTQRYGGSTEFAGQAILVTTILSVITMPLGVYFMNF